jgi:hypothetical protein
LGPTHVVEAGVRIAVPAGGGAPVADEVEAGHRQASPEKTSSSSSPSGVAP